MTDEQIKQNAEEYAGNSAKHLQQPYEEYKLKYDAYTAGAHSRDEEIEELKKKLEDMTKLKNFFASSLDIYDKDNKELQEQLKMNAENIQKLRNPWISVKDQLPPRDEKTVFPTDSVEVYAICDNYPLKVYTRVRYSYPFKWWTIGFENPDNPKEKLNVTHWMLIPELPKGE